MRYNVESEDPLNDGLAIDIHHVCLSVCWLVGWFEKVDGDARLVSI